MTRSRLLSALPAAAAALPARANAQDPSAPSIQAQDRPPAVRGVVVDAASGRPVAGATVHIDRAHVRAGTGTDGTFAVGRARAGTQLLRVRAPGYEPAMQLVDVPADGGAEVRIALTADPIVLEGIRVVADRLESRRRAVPLSSQVFRGTEPALSASPGMQAFVRTMYDPSELAGVEAYRGGAIIHLFTVAYLERAARRPDHAPQPLLF